MTSGERYAWLKSQHRCTKCGARDERTEAGRIHCAKCAETHNAEQRRLYDREKNTIETRRYIAKRIAEGKCIRCREPAAPGHLSCEKHLAMAREYAKRKKNKTPEG